MIILAAYVTLGLAVVLICLLIAEAENMPTMLQDYHNRRSRHGHLPVPVSLDRPVFDPRTGRWRHPVTKRFVRAPRAV